VEYDQGVVREALTELERARGLALGAALRRARGELPVRELAARSGLAEETIRKIERGGVPTPALFTVAAITAVLDIPLDDLVRAATATSDTAVA
jgi:transcriptional regulator with XRE-family HTH domain